MINMYHDPEISRFAKPTVRERIKDAVSTATWDVKRGIVGQQLGKKIKNLDVNDKAVMTKLNKILDNIYEYEFWDEQYGDFLGEKEYKKLLEVTEKLGLADKTEKLNEYLKIYYSVHPEKKPNNKQQGEINL